VRVIHPFIQKLNNIAFASCRNQQPSLWTFFWTRPNVAEHDSFSQREIIDQQTDDFYSLKNVGSVVAFMKLNGIRVLVGCSSEHYAMDFHRPDQAKTIDAAFAQTS